LADVHFASARTIVLVQDNLSVHSKASLYQAFPATTETQAAPTQTGNSRPEMLASNSSIYTRQSE
jgi:hypothetical protein